MFDQFIMSDLLLIERLEGNLYIHNNKYLTKDVNLKKLLLTGIEKIW